MINADIEYHSRHIIKVSRVPDGWLVDHAIDKDVLKLLVPSTFCKRAPKVGKTISYIGALGRPITSIYINGRNYLKQKLK